MAYLLQKTRGWQVSLFEVNLFIGLKRSWASLMDQMVKNLPAVQECKRCRFDPWVGKISWRREWQPTPVFLPGEFHRQKSLGGRLQFMVSQRIRHDWAINKHIQQILSPGIQKSKVKVKLVETKTVLNTCVITIAFIFLQTWYLFLHPLFLLISVLKTALDFFLIIKLYWNTVTPIHIYILSVMVSHFNSKAE